MNSMPGDWILAQLNSGNALVVLDGWDELSELHKSGARGWLDKLMEDHPRAQFLITSRPEGLDYHWFDHHEFVQMTLQPMSLPDIRDCIDGWFRALSRSTPSQIHDFYEQRRRELHSDIDSRPTVRDLAETPLLCAMLCAFYCDELSDAPRSRAELYGRVINTLVDARDRMRKSIQGDHVRFRANEKLALLQAIARTLTDQARTTIRIRGLRDSAILRASGLRVSELGDNEPTVQQIVQSKLGQLPMCEISDAREATHLLVERSVIFVEVADGQAEFAHRTFQEYLTACDYVATGSTRELARYALEPGWSRVIALAAAQASGDTTGQLIAALLRLTEENEGELRRRLLLLIADCLGTTTQVNDEGVIARAKTALAEILPPRDLEEAEAIAAFGEAMLGWLSGHENEGLQIVRACIRAAGLIGGPSALDILAEYSVGISSRDLIPEFIEYWDRFDPTEYVDRVLSNIDLGSLMLPIRTKALLEPAGKLTQVRGLRLETRVGPVDFTAWRDLSQLRDFDCGLYHEFSSLYGAERLEGLRRLNLSRNRNLNDFSPLSSLPSLEELYLNGCTGLVDPEPLADLQKLRILVLDGCGALKEFGWLASLSRLQTLSLNDCEVYSLAFCSALLALRSLRANSVRGVRDISSISTCNHLRRLEMKFALSRSERLVLSSSGSLREVALSGAVRVADLEALGAQLSLQKLHVTGLAGLEDVGVISELTDLRELSFVDVDSLSDISDVANLVRLRTLDLSGSSIEHLNAIRNLTRLEHIRLDRCHRLIDISALLELRRLKSVSMLDGVPANPMDLEQLMNSRNDLEIDHDPYLFVGHAGA
jgi:Leucine-rich repeat (LRR) protein